MKIRTLIKRTILIGLTVVVLYVVRYCWISFPIAAGYGSKILCSAVFVSGRNEKEIKEQELHFYPLNLATTEVNYKDSSVTTTMFGFAKRKAIYRNGLGATIVSEWPEQKIRSQHFRLAHARPVQTDSITILAADQTAEHFPAGIDKVQLDKAIDNLFREDSSHPVRTRAVVVLYDGKLVAEKYAPGFTKDTRLTGWSMTKSITGALIGVLVKQNKINIDRPAPVPEWTRPDDPRHAITTKHLLQQCSGLDFEEAYGKSSDATRMLFQRADAGAYAASHSLKHPPGSVFYYSSGNTNILSRMIRHIVGEKDYHAFPYEQLLYKIGMYNTVMETDASGTFVGSSFCFATARDWARFGLLYLNDGVYNNERILPEGWVRQTATPASPAEKGEYGFQFWLNAGEKNNPSNRMFPGIPEDMFYADGFEGQNIFILPSKKLVIVRLGLTRNGEYGADAFLANIIQAVR